MDAGTGECKHDLRSFRKEHGDSTRVLLERPCQCSKRLCFQQFRGRESDVLAERFDFHKKEAYKKEPYNLFSNLFSEGFCVTFFPFQSIPKSRSFILWVALFLVIPKKYSGRINTGFDINY